VIIDHNGLKVAEHLDHVVMSDFHHPLTQKSTARFKMFLFCSYRFASVNSMQTDTATAKTGVELKNDAITCAFETLKYYDGDGALFRVLEAIRCLEYIFGSALRSALQEVRRGLYAGSVAGRRESVALALQDVEEHLSYWGYIA
jgi:hypothetical protein